MQEFWKVGCLQARWQRFVDVDNVITINIHAQPFSFRCRGDWLEKVQFSRSCTNVASPCFLLKENPAILQSGMSSFSAEMQWVSCRRIRVPPTVLQDVHCLSKKMKLCVELPKMVLKQLSRTLAQTCLHFSSYVLEYHYITSRTLH